MVRRLLALALAMAFVGVMAGCVVPKRGPVLAPIVDTRGTVAVGDTSVGMDNVGSAQAEGIILFGRGDASLTAAMKNGSKGPIERIHHVDSEELNVLYLYCRQKVTVYGE